MKRIAILAVLFAALSAQGMGIIRQITNAPPIVTNTPPPVVVPPVTVEPTTWNTKEIKSYGGTDKIKFIHAVPRGILLGRYNRESRENSWVDELSAGKWTTIYKGDEETIGAAVDPEPEPAAVLGDTLYLQAERGENVLRYSLTSGKITKGARLSLDYKWNVENVEWKAKGTVAFGGTGPSKPATIFSAITGKKLFTSPLNGLVAGLAEDPKGTLWLAISDNQKGICNSLGWKSQGIRPASVAAWLGTIYAGSQVDGWIYRLDGEKWVKFYDAKASKVNRLVVDPRDNCLLAAASNPDHILRFRPDGGAETLGRWTDQPQTVSGEQFDCYVNPGPGNTILGARALKVGAKAYQFSPSGTQPPQTPQEPPTQASFDPSTAKWIKGVDPRGWPAVADLKVYWGMSGTKRGIYMEIGPGLKGKDCKAMVLIQRDVLYAGSWDSIGDSPGRKFKQATNLGYKNEKGGPYIAGDDKALRKLLMPKDGEEIALMCGCLDVKQTTKPAVILWTPEK